MLNYDIIHDSQIEDILKKSNKIKSVRKNYKSSKSGDITISATTKAQFEQFKVEFKERGIKTPKMLQYAKDIIRRHRQYIKYLIKNKPIKEKRIKKIKEQNKKRLEKNKINKIKKDKNIESDPIVKLPLGFEDERISRIWNKIDNYSKEKFFKSNLKNFSKIQKKFDKFNEDLIMAIVSGDAPSDIATLQLPITNNGKIIERSFNKRMKILDLGVTGYVDTLWERIHTNLYYVYDTFEADIIFKVMKDIGIVRTHNTLTANKVLEYIYASDFAVVEADWLTMYEKTIEQHFPAHELIRRLKASTTHKFNVDRRQTNIRFDSNEFKK